MSDQATVAPNLHFLIERAHIKCLGEKIFQGYFDTCSKQPYYDLLQKYKTDLENKGEKPTFLDFLERPDVYQRALKIVTGENQENLANGSLSQKDLAKIAKAYVKQWNKSYQSYERHESIENPPSFEEFSRSCSGESWYSALEVYQCANPEGSSLNGFLRFVNEGLGASNKSQKTFAMAQEKYALGIRDAVFNREFVNNGPDIDLHDYIERLNQSPYLVQFVLDGTVENELVGELLKGCFRWACAEKNLLKNPREWVTIDNLRISEGPNATSKLTQELNEARSVAAVHFYGILSQISVIADNKNIAACDNVINEAHSKCQSGHQQVLMLIQQVCETRKVSSRTLNGQAVRSAPLGENDNVFVTQCRDSLREGEAPLPTSITPATPQKSPSSAEFSAFWTRLGGQGLD